MKIKFGLTFGLNVARLGLDEMQVITAAQIADRTNFDSVWAMDHTNVPQWKNAVVNDAWLMLAAIGCCDQQRGVRDMRNRCHKEAPFNYRSVDSDP